ncbi:uncharacterized protein N7484_010815 [Penicillium longicatenatum]|uniref:uncharacterized protein n=1 Tax=Penicillium longicatenatum TaxID=1561947 RepID=UPI00254959BB|nr:uncharacterized protein N7484_010815 [Penicillium longicatenatum]KAJ5630715.1 hypothetical protein N7484_010815 [Penicillium longicatenatum]
MNILNPTPETQFMPPPIQRRHYTKSTMPRPQVPSMREKQLERNRVAANKCREKRKQEHAKMQNALDIQAARHKNLQAEVGFLKEEIWYLKNELFVHAKCDDQFINSQLDEMASRFTQGAGDPTRCPSPSFSVSTRSDQSVVDHGTTSKTAKDGDTAREFYGGGLFDSFVDVPNM